MQTVYFILILFLTTKKDKLVAQYHQLFQIWKINFQILVTKVISNEKLPLVPFWMTGVTSLTLIQVTWFITMFVKQVGRVVVLVAIYATERLKIVRCSMAFVTFIPFSIMISAEYWEIELVVLHKITCIPSRVSIVA